MSDQSPTSTLPKDQWYVYVICFSKQVSVAELFTELDKMMGPLQMFELMTAPPVTVKEWWEQLTVKEKGGAEGSRVSPVKDGVKVLHGDGRVWKTTSLYDAKKVRVRWDVWGIDVPTRRIRVLFDSPPSFPTGLWVSADDIELFKE